MRKIMLTVLVLAASFCLTATGSDRDTVKIYFTVGPYLGQEGATQMWRCNVDGTEPELLLETTGLGAIDIDSVHGIVLYSQDYYAYKAGLDLSNPIAFAYSTPLYEISIGLFPFDVNGGYLCYDCEGGFCTEFPGGGSQTAMVWDFPGIPPSPALVGVALHVSSGSGVESAESMSWGRIKSTFR
jgi:hypothetical protein